MKVAEYNTHGPFAGAVQMLRQVTGPQRWRVEISATKADGLRMDDTIRALDPIPLSQMREIAIQSINEVCAEGETVRDARMLFYVEGRR